MQGDPVPHCGTLKEDLESADGFRLLGHWHVEDDMNGAPHHPGLPLREYWDDWIGGPYPDKLQFVAGGQWVAPAELLLSRPVTVYQQMVGEMSRPKAPWVMERLWRYWFNDGEAA